MNKSTLSRHRDILNKMTSFPTGGCEIKILDKKLIILRNVYPPSNDSIFLCKNLPNVSYGRALDVGCGSGIISIFLLDNGFSEVCSVDINDYAIKNTKINAAKHNYKEKIKAIKSNIFEKLSTNCKFNLIVANLPIGYRTPTSINEEAIWNNKFSSYVELFSKASLYLDDAGEIYVSHATFGQINLLLDIAKEHGYYLKRTIETAIPNDARESYIIFIFRKMNKNDILYQMYRYRFFGEKAKELYEDSLIKGYCHLSLGLESISAALSQVYLSCDSAITSYRCHSHMLAVGSKADDMFAEMLGKQKGVSNAHGGSMHMFNKEKEFYGGHGIVGSQVPLGVGLAFAKKYIKDRGVCFTFLGDGSINQGQVLESFNLASLWELPVIFVIENNSFSIGTHISESTSNQNLFEYGDHFNIKSKKIDALDAQSVLNTFRNAKNYTLKNMKPYLIEIKCKRLDKHSTFHTISKEQEDEINRDKVKNDCITYFINKYTDEEGKSSNQLSVKNAQVEVDESARSALSRFDETQCVDPLKKYSSSKINTDKNFILSYKESISLSIIEEMDNDPTIYLLGEDVGEYGGAYGVTKNVYLKFGKNRVKDTPVSEAGFTGLAIGSAYYGLKPIVEFMSFNFVLPAIDQIINSAAKIYSMSGGKITCPIVFRGSNGRMDNLGAQHNHCYASWFLSCPGLIVLAPSNSQDAYLLIKEAVRNPNPVIFLEHTKLYSLTGKINKGIHLPKIGKANILIKGSDITIVSYSYGVELSKKAIKIIKKDITIELIDLVSISPLDINTIKKSAFKTRKLLFIDEGWSISGIGSEIIARLSISLKESVSFHILSSEFTPVPYSYRLESDVRLSPEKIAKKIIDVTSS